MPIKKPYKAALFIAIGVLVLLCLYRHGRTLLDNKVGWPSAGNQLVAIHATHGCDMVGMNATTPEDKSATPEVIYGKPDSPGAIVLYRPTRGLLKGDDQAIIKTPATKLTSLQSNCLSEILEVSREMQLDRVVIELNGNNR